MKKITYVTGNYMKVLTAKGFLDPLGFIIDNKKMDVPEIQADTTEEVAIFSSKWAHKELGIAVLKNDSALVIPSLNNFPGPYTRYVENTLTEDGILKLMEGKENRYAYWIEVLAYTDINGNTKTFTSITEGSIALKKSGSYGWGYDYIFILKGDNKTFANYTDEERVKLFDSTAYIELANYLKDK